MAECDYQALSIEAIQQNSKLILSALTAINQHTTWLESGAPEIKRQTEFGFLLLAHLDEIIAELSARKNKTEE